MRLPRLLALGIAVMIMGSDAWSVDGALAGAATRERASAPAEVARMTGAGHLVRIQTTIEERR